MLKQKKAKPKMQNAYYGKVYKVTI